MTALSVAVPARSVAVPARRVRYGAAYYAEYQPYDRLEADLDLMVAAGFTIIRVGESVWSTWEPADGVFSLEWLQPVLDGAHARGIDVMLGTPTYAMPPWLARKYPEVLAQRRTGVPIAYGHRQNADFTHPAFRHHAERVIRAIASRYADHPAVVGWQVDNEPGIEILYNPGVFAGFVEVLRGKYHDVDTLNRRWGLTYWSHRLSEWADLWTPDGNTTPAYDLEWRRYQASLTDDFIAWQAAIVREYARDDQFVTTCVLPAATPALDATSLAQSLDIATINAYYTMQDSFCLPNRAESQGNRPSWLAAPGITGLYQQSDIAFGMKAAPFYVTETNATTIGDSNLNYPAYDGQWRQAAWAMVSRGAEMVSYWHWHTAHFGRETYWGGVLGHSLEPSRCYDEIARIGSDFAAAGAVVAGLSPDSSIAFLHSPESEWAMQFHPPLSVDDAWDADPRSYRRIVDSWYRGAFAAGLQAAFVNPGQLPDAAALAARWPILAVPCLLVADDALLELLAAYAAAGGHLIAGFRTGYADRDARPRPVVMPGLLRAAVGASYTEFANLPRPLALRVPDDSPLTLPSAARSTAWADCLEVADATPIAFYDDPHFGRWAAATTRAHGAGRVTYLGTLPNNAFANALFGWVGQLTDGVDLWVKACTETVTATGATNAAGQRLRFISNWSWQHAPYVLPAAATDVISGEALSANSELSLHAWDVRVLAVSAADMPTTP